jgi:DNA processing protein
MNSLAFWLSLKEIRGIGNRLFLQLIEHFGEPENILNASRKELQAAGRIPEALASRIVKHKIHAHIKEELELVSANNGKLITFLDPNYPALLRQIADPPPYLYVYGNLRPDSANIAIVGSRNATTYGRTTTERLSANLASCGLTIVSGMARGIDSAAHKGALSAQGETIAVLGCGLGTIYPPENKRLFHEIAKNGAVISEFAFHAPPEAHHFPIRNRIISGLALGTVIVEATQKSGSLITARLAAEQGREVFAVPGSITSFKSMGTHKLIKQGAKLVEHVNDILEELNIKEKAAHPGHPKQPVIETTAEEKRILDELSPYPIHIDNILRQVPLSAGKVSSLLLQLELKGLVNQSPGKLFARFEG